MGERRDTNKIVDWVAALKNAGFSVTEQQDRCLLVTKHGCGAVLEKTPGGEPRFAARPGLVMRDGIGQLLDRGYQKFWKNASRTIPAVAADLKAFHCFERDLRAVMGMTSLYNESLGTVSSRYVYDRVEGRENAKVHQSFD